MGTLQMPLSVAIDTATTTTKPQVDNDEFDCLLTDDNEADAAVAEVEVKPESKTPEAIPATADKDYYEIRFEAAERRYNAERGFCTAGLRVLSLEEDLEEATKSLEAACTLVATFDGDVAVVMTKPPTKPAPEPFVPPPAAAPCTYKERLESPSSMLNLDGINWFGKVKMLRLFAEFPTIGHIESARARAVRECRHFSYFLSQGIGTEIGEEIEKRLLAYLGEVEPLPPTELDQRIDKREG